MVDSEARGRLAEAIEAYLDERLTAFDFDEQITSIAGDTDDATVRQVAEAMWFFYDDCENHNVALSKEAWDAHQRFLLLLKSDAEIRVTGRREWTWTQAAAVAGLSYFLIIAYRVGFGEHLFVVAIPFALLSMLISWVRRAQRESQPDLRRVERLAPFGSLGELLAVRWSPPDFRKRQCPPRIARRRVRSPIMDRILKLQMALLFQAIPRRASEYRVVIPKAVS
jgi:hypothetical protein